MTAPSGSEPVSPFLAFVGPHDRNPLRLGLWFTLGGPLAIMGSLFAIKLAEMLEPNLHKSVDPQSAHVLYTVCAGIAARCVLWLALALPLLGAARLTFQRPAWTFVSPARPVSLSLLATGMAIYAVLTVAVLGVNVLMGSQLTPPLVDASQPLTDRIVYVLALVPILLMSNTAQEVLFRGVLLQVSGAYLRTRIGLCIVNGLMNGLVNVVLLWPQLNPLYFFESAITGVVFAYAVLELGGLEFSVGAAFAADLTLCLTQPPSVEAARTSVFHWSDLARPEVLIMLGEMTAVAIATVSAVEIVKRYRKAQARP
jgi:membrane protease YdiL (CAAX protease family)